MAAKVCIINIGNELLLGQTVNTNLNWLGMELASIGLPVNKAIIVKDESEEIKQALQEAWQDNEIVIVSGGLGPTDDDITKKTIAEFFGKDPEFRPEIWENVQQIFKRRNLETPEINKSQAIVPKDFTAFENKVGTAPGLYFQSRDKKLFALPGVPSELQYLFTGHIKEILKKDYPSDAISIRTIHTWGISESALAEKLAGLKIQQDVNLAWLPQTGRVDLRLYGADKTAILSTAEIISDKIHKYVWGYDGDSPAKVLQEFCLRKNVTISLAESCTGGLAGKMITDVPGASGYFNGGVISYHNAMKEDILSVDSSVLSNFGAVSEETAREMALGVRKLTKSDFGLSITGIAGPEGGSPDKPVGTVCFSISSEKETISKRVVFNGDRSSIRFKAAEYIILLLIEYVGREA
jgi:nicotinamide-nucleotide amidase